ncbi:baseplate hub protein [Burkholderia gladioli]|uniref:baseplate hub protein n=1 Tax=Burkholderia gladioli TaxID=28095 RepID=UPI003F790B7B
MSFTKKRIDVTLSLGTGTFGESGASTVTLTGLRVQAMIRAVPGDSMPHAQVRIYGLSLSMMNQLTSVGLINASVRMNNTILVAAGDDEDGLASIYDGSIKESWGQFEGMPDVALNVIGVAGGAAALKPAAASSFTGPADVATIMQGFAQAMDVQFENNGVNVQLSNPYFPGTTLMQVKACARAADIYYTLDRGTLAIWPRTGARSTPDIPVISPATGMVGYPTLSSNAIQATTEFNHSIIPGGYVRIQSSLTPAAGVWYVSEVIHTLESETPNGQWFTRITARPTYAS